MSKKQERISQMLILFSEKECLSCKELSERLGISEMTVRRDLASLQESNIITRGSKVGTFSLVSTSANTKEDYEFSTEITKNISEKARIGAFAASMVSPGDAIIVDTGTTTIQMVQSIPDNINFSALCYNANIFKALYQKEKCDVILVGGQLNRSTLSFGSSDSSPEISNFRASKFFMAASGIHEKLGLTCGYRSELYNKQLAINSSLTKILLTDSSKFGVVRAAYFGELDDIDIIITDTNLPKSWEEIIGKKGIRLYKV